MNLSPRTCSRLADLLRILATWLAVVLVMQGFQGARALGAGPQHTHRADVGHAAQRAHSHGGLERHYHELGDPSVQRVGPADEGLPDATSLALTLAMALMAFAAHRQGVARTEHLLHEAQLWFCCSVVAPPLRRPPRLG